MRSSRFQTASKAFTALVVLLSAAFFTTPAEARTPIDHLVAIINNQIVIYSDILIQAEILKRVPDSLLPADQLQPGDNAASYHKRVFREVVLRKIVYAEATKLNMTDVDAERLAKEKQRLVAAFPTRADFDRFCYLLGMTGEQVELLIRQRIVCQNYIQKKIGLQVRINRRTYYRDNQARYGGAELEDVQDQVDADLYGIKLTAWFGDILGRTDVRIVDPDYEGTLQ